MLEISKSERIPLRHALIEIVPAQNVSGSTMEEFDENASGHILN